MEGIGTTTIRDIDASRLLAFHYDLKSRPKRPIGARSFNKRLKACKAFCAWLVKERRLAVNPLAHLSAVNEKVDRRHKRRAATVEELARLFAATESGPDAGGMSGPERAMGYRVAIGTGFRRRELNSLTPAAFDLTSRPATATVQAAYSKRRKDDRQEIPPDLASRLRPYLAGRAPRGPLWNFPRESAEVFRTDLAAAGIAYRDDSGDVLDFHSLRHTYVSMLSAAGLPTVVVKEMARHASVTTTERYMHARFTDRARALDALPVIESPAERAALAATGTDGAVRGAPARNTGATRAQHAGGIAPQRHAFGRSGLAATTDQHKPLKTRGLPSKNPRTGGGSSSEADGTRTRNHRIDSQPGECPNPRQNAGLRDIPQTPAAPAAAPGAETPLPPDLAAVVAAWPALPPAVRAGIVAMVQASAVGR